MKRLCLLSVVALALVPSVANAVAKPGIIYIPVEDVTLQPSGEGECVLVGFGDVDSSLGCTPGVDVAEMVAPHADAATLAESVATALAAFDVRVTTERPPGYLPYFLLLPSDTVSAEGTSFTCTSSPSGCAGRRRNAIGFTNGGTTNCTVPDLTQQTLYAVGRMIGLEGSENELDPMHFPPDYENVAAASAFQDMCDAIAPQLALEDPFAPLPLECTSVDHEGGGCEAGNQNTVQDLLAYFGPSAEDLDAPVLTNILPEDGAVIEGELNFDVDIEEASGFVGVQWTVSSPVLDGVEGVNNGEFTWCTNPHCDTDFGEGQPFLAVDAEWGRSLSGLPAGDYTITLEVSDYHGNDAEAVVINVTIGEGPPSGSSGMVSGSASASESGVVTVTASGGGSTSGAPVDPAGTDDGDEGCSCSQSPSLGGGTAAVLFGLFGFGLIRRRR